MKRHGGAVCIDKWKKPIWKGPTLDDSNYMTFWKRKLQRWRKDQWLPEVQKEGERDD